MLSPLQSLYGKREAQALVRMVVEDVCGISWTKYLVDGCDTPQFRDAIARLAQGEPVQHIIGYSRFCEHRFRVNEHVLVPRPETEELVDWVVGDAPSSELRILDVGTGSGCIAVSLAHALPQAHVTALDVSQPALEVARGNDFTHSVTFLCHDILSVEKPPVDSCFDIIVSNPPYICRREAKEMHANVLEHEPHLALFVPDDDPLLFYRAIARHGLELLRDGGCLYFEINRAYGAETVRLLAGMGYADIQLRHDRFGNPRMIKAKKS